MLISCAIILVLLTWDVGAWITQPLSVSTAFHGEGIKCVQCTSLRSRECEYGSLPARQCIPDMPYCILYVGKLHSGAVVFRDCNKNNMTNACTRKMMGPRNSTLVRVCYETCDYDGCNGGPLNMAASMESSKALFTLGFFLVLFFLPVYQHPS